MAGGNETNPAGSDDAVSRAQQALFLAYVAAREQAVQCANDAPVKETVGNAGQPAVCSNPYLALWVGAAQTGLDIANHVGGVGMATLIETWQAAAHFGGRWRKPSGQPHGSLATSCTNGRSHTGACPSNAGVA